MKRPRLTRGQSRALAHLAYLDGRAVFYGQPQPVSVTAATTPYVALLRHGYVRLIGDGYYITHTGLSRYRRGQRAGSYWWEVNRS